MDAEVGRRQGGLRRPTIQPDCVHSENRSAGGAARGAGVPQAVCLNCRASTNVMAPARRWQCKDSRPRCTQVVGSGGDNEKKRATSPGKAKARQGAPKRRAWAQLQQTAALMMPLPIMMSALHITFSCTSGGPAALIIFRPAELGGTFCELDPSSKQISTRYPRSSTQTSPR